LQARNNERDIEKRLRQADQQTDLWDSQRRRQISHSRASIRVKRCWHNLL